MAHSAEAVRLGATLRLLRVGSQLSLRELARRIGVSTAYLSRVENGHDAAPTPERLAAIAKELDVPAALLVDMAHRVSPYLAHYLEQEPAAGVLFMEVARRQMGVESLLRMRQWLEAEFPAPPTVKDLEPAPLSPLLSPERVVLQLRCTSLADALDVVAGRLLKTGEAPGSRQLAAALIRREAESPTAVGGGVAVPHATLTQGPPRAVLVTLAQPLSATTPDGQPLRLLVVLATADRGRPYVTRLAHVARLAAHGLAERLAPTRTSEDALRRLAIFEAMR